MYIPGMVVTGQTLYFRKHCSFEFSLYYEANKEPTPSNMMAERMHGMICLETPRG